MELILVFAIASLALIFAAYVARLVLHAPEGEPDIVRVAGQLRVAAETFVRQQATTVGAVAAVLGGAIFLSYGLLQKTGQNQPVSSLETGVWLTASFALGVLGSLTASFLTTRVGARAALHAASGAKKSIDQALQISVRGASISALSLGALSLIGTAGLFAAVFAYRGGFGADPAPALRLVPQIPALIMGFPLGAVFAGLLSTLSGGSFGTAADIGSDLAGKENGLAEDDAQNPAALADLAGDLVGGGAGRAAGLFAASATENVAAMFAGALLFRNNASVVSAVGVMLFPLVARAFGLLASAFGVMVVRTDDREDPLHALARGLYVTTVLHAVGLMGLSKWLLGPTWWLFFGASMVGSIATIVLLFVAQYFTEQRYGPVRELAEMSRGGPTLTLLRGGALGLDSMLPYVIVLSFAAVGAFELGRRSGLADGGLFGLAACAAGMLGASGYVLSADGFGPIVDGAGGIVQMTVARERPDVRGRTLVLDAAGNTIKTWSKGFAAAGAALTALLLLPAFLDAARARVPTGEATVRKVIALRVDRAEVIVAALAGVLLVAWIAARCIGSAVRSARRVADEARRQMRARPSGAATDHEAVIEMLARAALRQMIWPAVVIVAAPVTLGVALRFAKVEGYSLLPSDAVAAFLLAATTVGVLSSLLLAHAGGAWDNAKKYIATGAHGGRYLVDELGGRAENPTYAAAIVGDTVGDVLKDVVCPVIHLLVQLLPLLALIFLPFFA
ncbi:MAG: sodium/proton-translocating pyrophosphatase [Polyangiaceae bacterium]|nr:sodium/proton-translocating pyrophosphatase [Polyangiaceae bacterium]